MHQYKSYNKEDIIRIAQREDVQFIRLQFVDILGTLKNVAISIEQLERALNGEIVFDGSSIEGFVRSREADMYLKPDFSTFSIFPWRPQQGKVARLICNIYKDDDTPFEGDPRFVLKKVIDEAEELGYKFKVGTECEFFLFNTDENGETTTVTHDKAGYFDLGPLDLGENVRRDIVLTLQDLGFEINASHHEVSPGQHEIDFNESYALEAADSISTFKLVVKVIAQRHGLHATFMPKPITDLNGSGMHCNLFLFDQDENNLFYNSMDKLKLSKEAYYFIGGIMKHIKAITAITNPTVNSYKRLVPGYEAPISIGYSASNNNSLIRIPTSRGNSNFIELRSPDPSINPYLAIAVILKAGIEGIKNKIEPIDLNIEDEILTSKDVLEIKNGLPTNLREALIALSKDEVIINTLGECYESYMKAKTIEWNEYTSVVHDWELQKYISKY